MEVEFHSLEELYRFIRPALVTKQSEMYRCGYHYIEPEDIWNYLKEIKWKNAINLRTDEMVNDILHTDDAIIDDYVRSKLHRKKRRVYFDESDEQKLSHELDEGKS